MIPLASLAFVLSFLIDGVGPVADPVPANVDVGHLDGPSTTALALRGCTDIAVIPVGNTDIQVYSPPTCFVPGGHQVYVTALALRGSSSLSVIPEAGPTDLQVYVPRTCSVSKKYFYVAESDGSETELTLLSDLVIVDSEETVADRSLPDLTLSLAVDTKIGRAHV